jgi:SAM-dependent methyltransferase
MPDVPPTPAQIPLLLDVGCGFRKAEGAWGIDGHPYPGVDQVLDLDRLPWALPESHFTRVVSHHVIEHVGSIPEFLREIHRVSKDGCEITISTPHFTGINSWADPTHRWHLACAWHLPFTDASRYLQDQLPAFEHVSTSVKFPGGPLGQLGRLICRWRGPLRWEERFAWQFPASEFTTVLRVRKPATA